MPPRRNGLRSIDRARGLFWSPDCWLIYYREVQVGTIACLSGVRVDVDQWGWMLRFYPGPRPAKPTTAPARHLRPQAPDFETAWSAFLPTRTEADFQAWRDQRDDTAWKYAMRDRGLRLPTEFADGREQCFCGAAIDIARCSSLVLNAHRGFEL